MGIIGNKTLFHKLPLTQVGGLFASDIRVIPNWHCKENASKLTAVPEGYYSGGAWILPETSGSITVDGGIISNHLFTVSNLAGGLNALSTVSGSGDISNANLSGLAFLISSLNQSSTLNSDISGSVNISANLVGNGDLNGALGALIDIVANLNGNGELNCQISGALQAIANLSGSGDIESSIKATVGLIASLNGTSSLTSVIIGNWNMVCDLLGQSNLSASVLAKAFIETNITSVNNLNVNNGAVVGSMSSDITSLSELSPESLASAVWKALAAQYKDIGTMGEIYQKIMEIHQGSSLTKEEIREEIDNNSVKLNELHQLSGLDINNPVVITDASTTTGTINLDISGNGETLSVITRQ